MNVLLTDVCNRKCSFCFADSPSDPSVVKYMSLENLRYVLSFLKKSDIHEFRCIGGEPTLHPKFIDMLNEVVSQNFSIFLFTNGVVSKHKTDYIYSLASINRLRLLCNVSICDKDTKGQLQQREYFFEKLAKYTMLSVTIDRPDFTYTHIIDLLRNYPFSRTIRVGVAHPVYKGNTSFLKKGSFLDFKKAYKIFEETLRSADIHIKLDCGMPACLNTDPMFTRSVCLPIVDVGVDLMTWSCFPLRHMNPRHLSTFENHLDACRYFNNKIRPLDNIPLYPECRECAIRNVCNQGCKAFRLISGT